MEFEDQKVELENLKGQMETAKGECGKPFAEEKRLMELQRKKVQLDLALEFKDGGEDTITSAENAGDDRIGDNVAFTTEQKTKTGQYGRPGEFLGLEQ